MTETGIKSQASPLLEGRSAIWAISIGLPDRHIPALYVLAFHPILHMADLKDKGEKFFKPWKTQRN